MIMKKQKFNLQLFLKVDYYTEVEAETLEEAMKMGKKMFEDHCFPKEDSLVEYAELHADNLPAKDPLDYCYLKDSSNAAAQENEND